MKYKTIWTIIIIAFIVVMSACEKQEPPGPNGKVDLPPEPKGNVDSPPPELTKLRSFEYRTKNYDMLSVQESKDWLRKNYWTIIYSGNTIRLQRNYVSENVTDKSNFTISIDSRAMNSISGTLFTTDDNGKLRVGFFRK